jgi:hypothetical protein
MTQLDSYRRVATIINTWPGGQAACSLELGIIHLMSGSLKPSENLHTVDYTQIGFFRQRDSARRG